MSTKIIKSITSGPFRSGISKLKNQSYLEHELYMTSFDEKSKLYNNVYFVKNEHMNWMVNQISGNSRMNLLGGIDINNWGRIDRG